ncbi:tripartite tricarboxylate transporter TctB family protein [Pseudochelatococcus sp. G4_1912]|uniref:tripartite tricarboxylate transporter TctB family protein n=1 Tax=Pseudochelatococcus sp. G4_1912 TaxID=3114288 RepID=UPI0039C5C48E
MSTPPRPTSTIAPAPRRARPDWAALVVAVALAILAAVVLISAARMAPVAQYTRIGPTVFPYAIATLLALLAIGTAIAAWRGDFPAREVDHYGPIAWITGGLVAQMLLMNITGFSIATGVLFAATARGFGRGPLWQTLPIGIVFAFIIWFIFSRGLSLSIPAGPLERLIP